MISDDDERIPVGPKQDGSGKGVRENEGKNCEGD